MLIEQLILNGGNAVITYRTYFTVDTTIYNLGDPSPNLYISSIGLSSPLGSGLITNIETGDGATASIATSPPHTDISYSYAQNTGTFSGYFDSEYGIYDLIVTGPITSITQIPVTVQTFFLTSNVDFDLSYLTNLQAVTLNKFNPSLPFLSTLNVTNLTNLADLQIFNADLTQLDLGGLASLQSLLINNSASLNTLLNKQDCTNLTTLDIRNCSFESVHDFHFLKFVISSGPNCYLYIDGNPISSNTIDISDAAYDNIYSLENVVELNAATCSLTSFSNSGNWTVSRPNTHPNLYVTIPYQVYKNSSYSATGSLTIVEDYYNQEIIGTCSFTDLSYYIPNIFDFGFVVGVNSFTTTLTYADSTIGLGASSSSVTSMAYGNNQTVEIHLESAGDLFDFIINISYANAPIVSSLSTLDLSNNNFTISSGLNLSTFGSLNILKVNNCVLSDGLLAGISYLTELYASYNIFDSPAFNDFTETHYAPNLVKLILSHNNLSTMWDSSYGLPSGLNYLDISYNSNLVELGLNSMLGAVSLSYLNISHTKLSSSGTNGYNDFMSPLTSGSLQYFYGDWSPITVDGSTIMYIIGTNPLLKIFKASHTNDASFAMPFTNGIYGNISTISTHTDIIEIDISYSNIVDFRFDNSSIFPSLETLNLSNSLISTIIFGNGSTFDKLITLNLSNNLIPNWTQATTNGDDINNFKLLQDLILNNNPIDIFNLRTSGEQGVLVNLDLENCTEITEINIGHLGALITLQNVNMNLNSSVGKTVTFYFENIIDLNSFTLSNTTIVGKHLDINSNISAKNTSSFYFGSLVSTEDLGDLVIDISDNDGYGPQSLSLYDVQFGEINVLNGGNPSVMNNFSVDSCSSFDANQFSTSISTIITNLASVSNSGGFINLTNNKCLATGQSIYSTLESKVDTFSLVPSGITFNTSSIPNYTIYNPNRDVLFTAYGNNKLIATDTNILSGGYGTGTIITNGTFSGGIYYKINSTSGAAAGTEEIVLCKSPSSPVLTSILVSYPTIASYSVLGGFTVTDPILDLAYDPYNEIVYLTGLNFLETRSSNGSHNIYTLMGTRSGNSKFKFDTNNNIMWATNGYSVEVFFTQSSPPTTIYTGLTNSSNQITFSKISNEMYVGENNLFVSNVLVFDCATSSYGTLKSTFQIPSAINRMEYNEWDNHVYIVDKNYEIYVYSCDEGILLGPESNYSQGGLGDTIVDITYNSNTKNMWISFGTSGGPNSNNISTYVNSPIRILLPVNELEVLRSLSWNITTDDYPVTALIDNDIYNYLQESGANGIKQTWAITKFTKLLKGEPYGAQSGSVIRTTGRNNVWNNLIAVYPYLPLNNTTVVADPSSTMNNYSVNLISSTPGTSMIYNNPSNLTFDDQGVFGALGSYGYNSTPLPHLTDNLAYGAYYENYSTTEDGLLGAINGLRYDGISTDGINSKFGVGNTYSTSLGFPYGDSSLVSVSRIGLTVSFYNNKLTLTQSSQVSLGPTTSIYYHALKNSSTGYPVEENNNRIKGFYVGENITSNLNIDFCDAWVYYLNAKQYV